eukprot:2721063-Pyramimonas_sp.AAC.1
MVEETAEESGVVPAGVAGATATQSSEAMPGRPRFTTCLLHPPDRGHQGPLRAEEVEQDAGWDIFRTGPPLALLSVVRVERVP